jgi:hypothetical protein
VGTGVYIFKKREEVSRDGWPSGLRRCLKEFVPAVFGRGFESHFIQYFCLLLLPLLLWFVFRNRGIVGCMYVSMKENKRASNEGAETSI